MRGIDISHHQGAIDWEKVKAEAGLDFVIIKAMFENGHSTESAFERNYAGAAGLQRGAYLYSIAQTIDQAQKEAVDFVRILGGRRLEYGVWLDYEDTKIRKLGKAQLTKHIDAQAQIIQGAGYRVGIYTNMSWYKNVIDGAGLNQRYEMWVARYPLADNGTIKDNLKPVGWCDAKLWQYSSKGKVPGIRGNVDLDIEMSDLISAPKPVPPTGNPYQEPTKNLKNGSTGNGVRWLQYELNWRGYGLVIDGIFGKNTEAAVRSFQNRSSLVCDGIVGPKTRAALRSV